MLKSPGKTFPAEPPDDAAVSPVVGIMLLLTITLILAAIISGMTGGLAQTQKKPPQLVFEASMVNNGTVSEGSFFDMQVISVSESIPTRDLKIQTEWKDTGSREHLTVITPGSANPGVPLGSGPGVTGSKDFGNYTLVAGTRLHANASHFSDGYKGMNATFSDSWINITEGTPLRIQFIHIPSGAIIADKEINSEV
jgi:FlaG/FlaF family flagellin (archaellin)